MLVLCPGNSHIHELRPRGFKNRSSLLNLHFGSQSALISFFIELQCLLVLRDRVLQQLLFGIEGSRREVINRQIGVHRQIHHRQISSARLRLLSIGLDILADPTPRVAWYETLTGSTKSLKVVPPTVRSLRGRLSEYLSRVAEGAVLTVG